MRYLRALHNGDPSGMRGTLSPRWEVCVSEDGRVWGESLIGDSARMLPEEFRIEDYETLFDIPQEFRHKNLLIGRSAPHYEDVIVSLVAPGGHRECTFLMSQLPESSRLRAGLQSVGDQIRRLTEPAAGGNAG